MALQQQLQHSWVVNANAWVEAVRGRKISSRRLVTDAAILEAVQSLNPSRVLDLGCGEGWLCRALASPATVVVGVDASEPLIAAARDSGGGTFLRLSYEGIAEDSALLRGPFDAVVANFALLDENVVPMLRALRSQVSAAGALVIQTVHPWTASEGQEYQDGWRVESFADFEGEFTEPMPWYFRTLSSWTAVLEASGWHIRDMREPLHPDTLRPLSLLVTCTRA